MKTDEKEQATKPTVPFFAGESVAKPTSIKTGVRAGAESLHKRRPRTGIRAGVERDEKNR